MGCQKSNEEDWEGVRRGIAHQLMIRTSNDTYIKDKRGIKTGHRIPTASALLL